MQRREVLVAAGPGEPGSRRDWVDLVDHQESVQVGLTVEAVHEGFRRHPHEFAAVLDGAAYVGLVSRGHLGFLLGTRFGYPIFGRHLIQRHLLPASLVADPAMNLMDLLDQALSRTGDAFYHDVPLVDQAGRYLGIIPVPSLVRAQSSVVAEQFRLAEAQRRELLARHQELFRSVHQLRQSQGRYETLFQNSPLAVALLHRDGRIEAHNGKFQVLLGSRAQDGALNLAGMIPARQREAFLELLRQQETGARPPGARGDEFPITLPGQEERLFELHASLVQETGQICAILHDITEQRRVERRMAIADKAALMESLVGGIAHELNNKLAPVLGFAELLEMKLNRLGGQEVLESHCGAIAQSAKECVRIIRQLLQLSRPATMELRPVELKAILEEAASILRFRIRAAEVRLELTLPATPLRILADASQIKQVLVNLLINAVDAMDRAVLRDLAVGVAMIPGGWAEVTVRDTGHGIPPDRIDRIFDPFYTTKSAERGTGLGLSVCLGIVRQHQGEISVESVQGQGTEFRVLLPLAPAEAPGAPGPPAAGALLPAPGEAARRLDVLVIDDEEYITNLVQELLRSYLGWRVERVHDGREAILRLEAARFDLVITDLRMPGVDGFALLGWLRTFRPELLPRVLVITGEAGGLEDLRDQGVPVLRKPFTPEELVHQCRNLTDPAPAEP